MAQAACTYKRSKGIPFAAYALRRIQAAVAWARHRAFATVQVPKAELGAHDGGACQAGQVVPLDFDPQTRAVADRHHPAFRESNETIADVIRRKYNRAVRRAVEAVQAAEKCRQDPAELIDRLVEERLLVPSEERRSSLRNIARGSGATFARVQHLEKSLLGYTRSILAQDPELTQLRIEARRSEIGVETDMDQRLRQRMAEAVGRRLGLLFQSSTPAVQGAMLLELLRRRRSDIGRFARSLLDGLTEQDRAAMLARWD